MIINKELLKTRYGKDNWIIDRQLDNGIMTEVYTHKLDGIVITFNYSEKEKYIVHEIMYNGIKYGKGNQQIYDYEKFVESYVYDGGFFKQLKNAKINKIA